MAQGVASLVPRHAVRRCKKRYRGEIFSPNIYYLNFFQLWVIFIEIAVVGMSRVVCLVPPYFARIMP
jgi:hypothetical protein